MYPYSIDPCLVDWHGNGVLIWGWKVRNLLADGYIIECKTFGSGLYFARLFKRRRDELQVPAEPGMLSLQNNVKPQPNPVGIDRAARKYGAPAPRNARW